MLCFFRKLLLQLRISEELIELQHKISPAEDNEIVDIFPKLDGGFLLTPEEIEISEEEPGPSIERCGRTIEEVEFV
jgi:hypothetical protein